MKALTALLLLCLFAVSQIAKAQNDDEIQVKLLPITPDIEMSAAKALHRCDPIPGKIVGEINKNNIYTLTGDLFHNGRIYSVIDDNADVIICEWHASNWKPISVINVPTEWNFPATYRAQSGRTPFNQSVPFWIIDYQDRPLLVIASEVDKAGQNYYTLLFSSTYTAILNTATSFAFAPETRLGYLLTGDCPRGRAEYGEVTFYSKIKNNTFTIVKSWSEFTVRHETQPDASGNYASSDGLKYSIFEDPDDTNESTKFQISYNDPQKIRGAQIQFTSKGNSDPNSGIEYIFEKLTGLPKELYPDLGPTSDSLQYRVKTETKWEVKVTGDDPALIKLLSTK